MHVDVVAWGRSRGVVTGEGDDAGAWGMSEGGRSSRWRDSMM
jgi:hypothetical protein